MQSDEERISFSIKQYKFIIADINNGIDLDKHLTEIEAAIKEVDLLIIRAKKEGTKTEGYENLKNELYYLKFLILEKS